MGHGVWHGPRQEVFEGSWSCMVHKQYFEKLHTGVSPLATVPLCLVPGDSYHWSQSLLHSSALGSGCEVCWCSTRQTSCGRSNEINIRLRLWRVVRWKSHRAWILRGWKDWEGGRKRHPRRLWVGLALWNEGLEMKMRGECSQSRSSHRPNRIGESIYRHILLSTGSLTSTTVPLPRESHGTLLARYLRS